MIFSFFALAANENCMNACIIWTVFSICFKPHFIGFAKQGLNRLQVQLCQPPFTVLVNGCCIHVQRVRTAWKRLYWTSAEIFDQQTYGQVACSCQKA